MKKSGVVAGLVMGIFLVGTSAVQAHDPIIFTDDQTEADSGPVLPDGTISFALYGSLQGGNDQRVFRVSFADGDPLYVSLLIPDLLPENALEAGQLPFLEVVDPSGVSKTLRPSERIPFAEPFSKTDYIRLIEVRDVAVQGEYTVIIRAPAPARFTVAVGEKELFGTPVEGVPNRSVGVAGVMEWYATAPVSAPTFASTTTIPLSVDDSSPTSVPSVPLTTETDDQETGRSWILVVALGIVAVGMLIGAGVRQSRRPRTSS